MKRRLKSNTPLTKGAYGYSKQNIPLYDENNNLSEVLENWYPFLIIDESQHYYDIQLSNGGQYKIFKNTNQLKNAKDLKVQEKTWRFLCKATTWVKAAIEFLKFMFALIFSFLSLAFMFSGQHALDGISKEQLISFIDAVFLIGNIVIILCLLRFSTFFNYIENRKNFYAILHNYE